MNKKARQSAAKRVIGNTLLLYFRMFVVMCISILSFRLLISNLHVTGYGVFTAASGLVLLFGFLNSAVINAAQRFLNIEFGKNVTENIAEVFSCSFFLFFILSLIVIALGETAGLYYLRHKLVYPDDFKDSINIVYQFLLISSCIKLIQQPFYLLVMASERMGIIAIASFVDAGFNLATVLLLFFFKDKVVMYAAGVVLNALIVLLIYAIYCKICHPGICRVCQSKISVTYLKKMSRFSGWSILGSVASGTSQQGQNLILNSFGGVLVSAAFGVSLQISNTVNAFLSNFQVAIIPYLIKSYVQTDKKTNIELVCRTSKYSLFLLSFFVVPIIVNTEMVLKILAPGASEYTLLFVRLAMIQLLLASLACPLYTQIQSTGNIALYQILISTALISQLPLFYFLLKIGLPFFSVYIVGIIIEAIALIIRLYCLKKIDCFPASRFCREVLLKSILVFSFVFLLLKMIDLSAANFIDFILKSVLIDTILLCVILGAGVSGAERRFLLRPVLKKIVSDV